MSRSGPRPPLFARLSAEADRAQDFDHQALAESVRQELTRLLNTRRPTRTSTRPLDVLDYGIADWSALQALRADDRRHLLRDIRNAIRHFEPRLQLQEIDIDSVPGQPQRLGVRLAGRLRGGQRSWPALFLLAPGGDGLEVRHERLD